MPPRANKRQLREQQELAALSVPKDNDQDDQVVESGGEDPQTWPGKAKQPLSVFAALGQDANEGSEGETSEPTKESGKKKKKKKKKIVTDAAASPEPLTTSEVQKLSRPKKSKPPKQQKQKASETKGDDIDRALAELSLKYPGVNVTPESQASRRAANTLFTLLTVSTANLDSEAEMRKFFGSKVVSASKTASSAARRRPVTTRSNLTNPQGTWPPANLRQGLTLRALTDEEIAARRGRHGYEVAPTEERVWTVEYGRRYKGVTKSFIHMVMSGDPEGFWHLLRTFPYHGDTLLQLSEVYSHREEHSTAADFIDRALFTYERAFVGSFNFTMGTNRLDFDRVENRPFFLALHRQIADLQRRGCVRTAFEFAKLLLALDPYSDPHGAFLHLDFLSIKAGQTQWLVDIWDAYEGMDKNPSLKRIDVRLLPGWAYARALALYNIESSKPDKDHTQSAAALGEAVRRFPSIVPLLADKADISLSSEIRSCPAFRIRADSSATSTEAEAVLHLLSHLYAQRSSPLWKAKGVPEWFATTVTQTFASSSFPRTTATPPPGFRDLFNSSRLAYSVYRHVLVLESNHRGLFGFFPSSVIAARQLACDPLPPHTRVTEYDTAFFANAEDPFASATRSRRQNERLLERLVPDAAARAQLQAFFDGHPHFAQRFPGGVVQFVQAVGQMPEGALEELMFAGFANGEGNDGQGGGQHMPGFLDDVDPDLHDGGDGVDDDDVGDHVDGEEEEWELGEGGEGEAVEPLPVRLWRNVLNRFWGGQEGLEPPQDQEGRDED